MSERLNRRIKMYQAEHGMNRAQLARMIGVDESTIWRRINSPRRQFLLALSAVTGIAIEELLSLAKDESIGAKKAG